MEVKLVVLGGKNQGREIPVTGPEFLIGRSEECHLRPSSDRVSRKHCAIRLQEGRVTVVDFQSTNHTFVNDEQVTSERELKNGDRLKVGVLEFEVQLAVSVGGKIKPKVHTILEAAARTVQATASKEDDLDITRWLENDEVKSSGPATPHDTLRDTHVTGHKPSDTTTIHLVPPKPEPTAKKEDKKPPAKTSSRFERAKKPSTQDSRDAANDTLRHFFNRKKP